MTAPSSKRERERKPTIVIAGNHQQYLDYIREQGAAGPFDPRWVEASRADRLRGLECAEVVEYGTYYQRKDLQQVREVAATRVR